MESLITAMVLKKHKWYLELSAAAITQNENKAIISFPSKVMDLLSSSHDPRLIIQASASINMIIPSWVWPGKGRPAASYFVAAYMKAVEVIRMVK